MVEKMYQKGPVDMVVFEKDDDVAEFRPEPAKDIRPWFAIALSAVQSHSGHRLHDITLDLNVWKSR